MKSWQTILTINMEMCRLEEQDIKNDPERFEEYFEDINNPTDEEVKDYFVNMYEEGNVSDEWEVFANGEFLLIKNVEPDVIIDLLQSAIQNTTKIKTIKR